MDDDDTLPTIAINGETLDRRTSRLLEALHDRHLERWRGTALEGAGISYTLALAIDHYAESKLAPEIRKRIEFEVWRRKKGKDNPEGPAQP